ncbi:hypothetical protein CGLO_00666 [Colletotrichum gloeosporioides Cg-14]|uniref:Uncharacterized protein n=1 Tax=Colletotrichum gloeosporioides (strain Cg-14) TaxID=1237896 RepID=T0KU24_COLGC|nr:hypothetical protein CGLO_00666 [Colletotrichum gloeosporioides Cg-14]
MFIKLNRCNYSLG